MALLCDRCGEAFKTVGALRNHARRHVAALGTAEALVAPSADGPTASSLGADPGEELAHVLGSGTVGLSLTAQCADPLAGSGESDGAGGQELGGGREYSSGDDADNDEVGDGDLDNMPAGENERRLDDTNAPSDNETESESDSDSDSESESPDEGDAADERGAPAVGEQRPLVGPVTDDAGVFRLSPFKEAHLDFVNTVQRARLTHAQVDAVLAYLARTPPAELQSLPRQCRTLMRSVERWGSMLAASGRPLDAQQPGAPPPTAAFVERVYNDGPFQLAALLRNLWAVLLENFLQDPVVAPQLHFGAAYVPPGQEPVLSEMWTGSWWRQAQAALPLGSEVLAIVLHLDDTPVWNQSLCPVYVTLGNLPLAARRLHALMAVAAYLPKLDAPGDLKNTKRFRDARRRLFHRFLEDLLAPVKEVYDRGGAEIAILGRRWRVRPMLAVVVADNEEKALLTLAYKKKESARPCHQCLVPRIRLGDVIGTAMVGEQPRALAGMREVVAAAGARGRAGADARRLAKALSIHPMNNALWTLPGFNVYHSPPDLLHDAVLGVWKRLVEALFAWIEHWPARSAADELDRRLHVMTAPPARAIKRFGVGGFRGLRRAEGTHYRSLMALLPLALVDLPLPAGAVALGAEAAGLAVEWVGLYGFLCADSFTPTTVGGWQVAAAAWGERLRSWLKAVGSTDGTFPKLHLLLGGHMRDAILRYGAPAGYDAGAFEGRHVSAVKVPARSVSRSAGLVPQLAKRARREELLDLLTHHLDQHGDRRGASSTAARALAVGGDGGSSPLARLSWSAGALDVATQAARLGVRPRESRRILEALGEFIAGEFPGELPAEPAAARDAAKALNITRMLRVRLASDELAYAHDSFRGQARFDDVAVSGPGSSTWYARLAVPARVMLPSGRSIEAVLVRWYELAHDPPRPTSATRDALAGCPRYHCTNTGLDWCLPEQLLRRATFVPDWAVSGTYFLNVYLEQLRPARDAAGNGDLGDGDDDDDDA